MTDPMRLTWFLANSITGALAILVAWSCSTKPTLMLMGRQDSVVGYRDAWGILENYPRATFAILDRAGHFLEIEQEGLFTVLVNEWLDRVEETANLLQAAQ